MISININTLIIRPVWEVFDFVTAPENNHRWQYGSLESVRTSVGDMQLGTVFSSFGHFMGRRIQSTFEVTEFEANQSYGFETISGPIQLQTSYSFETVDHGTNLVVSSLINPGGFFKLVDPIVARTTKKQFKENLERLKELLEAREFIHSY
ncbi:MAG: SRPBCC family protein [Anaerolineales bacterium]